MIVSPSMSLVAAGVASGICFILLTSIRKGKAEEAKKREKQIVVDDSRCSCCLKPFTLEKGARCNDCGARSCRKGCSRWDTAENAWHCLFCHQQRSWLKKNEKWFETFGGVVDEEELHRYFSTAKSRVYVAGVENAASSSELALAAGSQEEANTMETVRDFVEKIVEGLIGNVDDTPIDRLYNHPTYDKFLAKYIVPLAGALVRLAVALQLSLTNKPTTDPPTMAHTALRDIVERAVDEARKLPSLEGSDETGNTQEGRSIAEQSYEDLLATAILNKVIEKFQREQVDGNSNVLHEKGSRTKCALSESETGLDEGVEEGCSSLEPLSQDDCSSDCSASCPRHARNHPEPLSLTIEERIEEVTTTYTSDEEPRDNDVLAIRNTHRVPFPELGMDIIDPSQESEDSQDEPDTPTAHVDMVSPIESWEENWLFQKKRVQTQADPVAMLVPNSTADFKALIGDKDAEDTSDLSECSSAQSDEEIEKELMEAISNVVPRSPKKTESEEDITLSKDVELSNGLQSNGDIYTNESTKKLNDKILQTVSNDVEVVREEKSSTIEKLGKTDSTEVVKETKENGECENSCNRSKVQIEKKDSEDTSETSVEEVRSNVCSLQSSIDVNEEIKTKEVEAEVATCQVDKKVFDKHETTATDAKEKISNHVEDEPEKAVADLTNGISIEQKKVEMERQRSDAQEEIAKTAVEKNADAVELKNEKNAEESKVKEFLEKEATDLPILEENVASEVPKTPACTPTRTSETENSFEVVNDADSFAPCDENVLNSLECAKKKLMVVDDTEKTVEVFDEDVNINNKVDFHADDAQQESEYTEHYDIATQRHLDSLTKIDVPSNEAEATFNETINGTSPSNDSLEKDDSKCREAAALAKAESVSRLTPQDSKEEVLATPPRPGTIAEREHKKWENAPPIENNPYSEESIQKRLFERQYSRRSSDIPGIHTELPKSNGADLEVVLTPHEPDIKRFGRDYYINNSKSACGDRIRRSAPSVSSRPSSSLSQRSSSIGAEQELQEEIQYRETDTLSNRSSDVKSKVAKWQKNNVEANYQPTLRRSASVNGTMHSNNTEKTEEKYLKKNDVSIDCQKTWQDQRVEDILENERKNNKNEINAKLNNQENYDNIESKKSFADEKQRKIRRIDLKAYGFENEFFSNNNKTIKTSPQRVVNKLDLKSFGYDGGLRRTQSNNHLDSTVNDGDFKPRIIKVTNKSNLTRRSDLTSNDCQDLIESQACGDNNLTQSTEALNKLRGESYGIFGNLKSAKSVPNIAKCGFYSISVDESDDYEVQSSFGDVNKFVTNGKAGRKNYEGDKFGDKNGDTVSVDDSENDTDTSYEKEQNYRSTEKLSVHSEKDEEERIHSDDFNDKRLPMPSVRRLAQAFSKQPEAALPPVPRATKTGNVCKERSSTPEIHIVETPRQMHSLTARSLSKKFREGLRQIPNKVTSPPASHVTMEQGRANESQTDVVQSKGENGLSDTDVISPGKLKSNIIFWEQMQKRS